MDEDKFRDECRIAAMQAFIIAGQNPRDAVDNAFQVAGMMVSKTKYPY